MSQLETVQLLASGITLQVLEYISKSEFRKFTDIKKEFGLQNGEVSQYISKLFDAGFIARYKNPNTHEHEGWKVTDKARKKLELIFATIDNFEVKSQSQTGQLKTSKNH